MPPSTISPKYKKEHSLEEIAREFPNIHKWISDPNIDNETSNVFWNHPDVTDSQITCLLKFRYNQYMGNARKQLFFGPTLHPTITCTICNSPELDTWKHVLLSCIQQHLHALRIKGHNKAIWEICKLIIQHKTSRCYTLMNAGTYNSEAPQNTVPPWLLKCTCINIRCRCLARLKPDLLCVQGLPYQSQPPTAPDLTIQLIEFTYCNDRFSPETITAKTKKLPTTFG
jgi:hypothetical protein